MLSYSGVAMFECARCDLFPIETAAAFRVAAAQVAPVDNSLFAAIALAAPHRLTAAVVRPRQHEQAAEPLSSEINQVPHGTPQIPISSSSSSGVINGPPAAAFA
jgi:hypothetical protein